MTADGFRAHLAFHLTGARAGAEVARALRPALLAGYRDPASLRGDYPLVLVAGPAGECVRSLARLIDELLSRLAPRGADGEALRLAVLRCEQEIRRLAAAGNHGPLSVLGDLA
ncbi:MAG TPA: hypothetical protein VL172_16305, partial [Kofleriaceae bacterium]|nr:hypothetical protein [Kofleriaceae bacterium]